MQNPYYAASKNGNGPVIVQGQPVYTQANVYGGSYKQAPSDQYQVQAVRGTQQPSRCNDILFGLLFIGHLAGMAYLAAVNAPLMYLTLGSASNDTNADDRERRLTDAEDMKFYYLTNDVSKGFYVFGRALMTVAHNTPFAMSRRKLEDASANGDQGDGDFDFSEAQYKDIQLIMGLTCLIAVVLSSLTLSFMMRFAETLIKCALWFNIVMCALVGTAGILIGDTITTITGFVMCALMAWFACSVWGRIPFAACNLRTAVTSVRANIGVTFFAYVSLFLTIGYIFWWTIASVSTVFVLGGCDAQGDCANEVSGAVYFGLVLSLYWTWQVIGNTVHVTIAGTVGTWWFTPREASSCCSKGVRDSAFRSITFSFGSICLGSLLVAIVQAIRAILESMRENGDTLLMCLADCILGCIESIIEYFNRWAFVYVGLYGYSFVTAATNVINLFKSRGWTAIITDTLLEKVLGMVSIGVGLVTGGIAALIAFARGTNLELNAFIVGFVLGFGLTHVLMGVVGSAVNTVIVCYAEDPNAFQTNHAELSNKMRAAWRQAWPVEFGY